MLILSPTNTLHGAAGSAAAITLTAYGDDAGASSDTFRVLYQGQLPTSPGVLLDASSTQRLIKTLTLNNTTSSPVYGVRLFVNGTAAVNRIVNLTLPPMGSATFGQGGWKVYDENGLPITAPQAVVGSVGFEFVQVSPLATWTINHNLGYRPTVGIFTAGGMEVEADVLHTSVNQTVLSFINPFAGFARLV